MSSQRSQSRDLTIKDLRKSTDYLVYKTTQSSDERSEGREPTDKDDLVYKIQFLYGFATLLTFNLILSSLDFFQLKVSYVSLTTPPQIEIKHISLLP